MKVKPRIRGSIKHFDLHLGFRKIGTEGMSAPVLKVNVVRGFDFDVSGCVKVDFWFYGCEDEDFIYYKRHIFGMEDKLLLEDLQKETTEIIATKFCYKRPLRARGSFSYLEGSVLTLKRLQHGGFSVHAACVARDGFAILMPGMPNTGKTLATLQLLRKGYEYLADDTLMVDSSGTAYCNPMESAVGTYILGPVNRLSRLRRTELRIRSFLRNFPGATKIIRPFMGRAWELVNGAKICQNAKVGVICIMEFGPQYVGELDKERALSKIMAINRYSLPRPQSNPVLLAYALFNPQFDLALFEEKERGLVSNLLDKTECYLIRCQDGQWERLIEQALRR